MTSENFDTTKTNERKRQLLAAWAEGPVDQKLIDELSRINKDEVALEHARKEATSSVVSLMAKVGITVVDVIGFDPSLKPSIESIFNIDEVRAGAQNYGLLGRQKANVRSIGASEIALDKSSNNGKKDLGIPVLELKVPKARGAALRLYQNTPLPADVSDTSPMKAGFKHVKDMGGNVGSSLRAMALTHPAADEFLKSPEGDRFIDKWAGWISRGGKSK